MPQAIALAAFNAGAPLIVVNSIIGVTTAGVIIHAAVTTALTIGGSILLQKLLAPGLPRQPSQGQFEFQQPTPIRFFTYGRMKISGPLAFLKRQDVNGGVTGDQLVKITMLGTREIDAIEEFFLNDTQQTFDGSLYFVGYFQDGVNHIGAQAHLGSDSQAADAMLVAGLTGWTSAHRLRSIPYVITYQGVAGSDDNRPGNFMAVYGGNGQKEVRVTIRGVKVYDPRLDSTNGGSGAHRPNTPSTWEWSDNVTLCILDFLRLADGYGIAVGRIDLASFAAAADIDDEEIDLKASGAEPRYRVATNVALDEPRKQVLQRLLQARDGRLYINSAGKIGIRGGKWVAPDVTIDADVGSTLLEAEFAHGIPAISRINQFELKALLPEHGYVEVDIEPWTKTDDPDWIAGIIRRQQLTLSQVPSNSQAQRLAKIYLARANPNWVGSIRTDGSGLDAIGEEAVNLAWAELDVPTDNFNGPFWIDGSMSLLSDGTGMSIPVRSADPDSYDWDPDTEEQDAPPVPV